MTKQANSNHLPAGYQLEEFEIERVLGEGGFGVAYLAKDRTLNQPRVLKEFLPGIAARRASGEIRVTARSGGASGVYRDSLARFIEEAQTLAALDHPNIVKVHRVLEANDTAYLVMPYYPGETLAQYLAHAGGTPPDPDWVQRLLTQVLEGLRVVHGRGIVHSDIKPANLYLAGRERPVLLDFGAARRLVAQGTQSLNTVISPGYTPIEQYADSGMPQGLWSDLYALGATFYELITGERPWDAPSRAMEDRLKPLSEIAPKGYPRRLLASLDRVLAVRPRDRYKSADEWLAALAAQRKSSGFRWQPGAVGALALVLLGGGYWLYRDQSQRTAEEIDKANRKAQEEIDKINRNFQSKIDEINRKAEERLAADRQRKLDEDNKRKLDQDQQRANQLEDILKWLKKHSEDMSEKLIRYDNNSKTLYTEEKSGDSTITWSYALCSINIKRVSYRLVYYILNDDTFSIRIRIEFPGVIMKKEDVFHSTGGGIDTKFPSVIYKKGQIPDQEEIKKYLLSRPDQPVYSFWKALQALIKAECEQSPFE
ncbi:MAG TPA: protein kinase [Candidatus Competibacteraceae bacterium]|nr:protein kinase [Candidatus Competibacteraceae bacterium]HRZ07346.1 protein kinase [Candidatus Competibacteraceae bacterium]